MPRRRLLFPARLGGLDRPLDRLDGLGWPLAFDDLDGFGLTDFARVDGGVDFHRSRLEIQQLRNEGN